jgi:hypothetical protein
VLWGSGGARGSNKVRIPLCERGSPFGDPLGGLSLFGGSFLRGSLEGGERERGGDGACLGQAGEKKRRVPLRVGVCVGASLGQAFSLEMHTRSARPSISPCTPWSSLGQAFHRTLQARGDDPTKSW